MLNRVHGGSYAEERADRIAAMWERWLQYREAHGYDMSSFRRVESASGRRNILRLHLDPPPPGWRYRSELEIADLGFEDGPLEIRQTDPTEFPPGHPGKVAEMARRLAAGEDLHHPQDATCETAPECMLASMPSSLGKRAARHRVLRQAETVA